MWETIQDRVIVSDRKYALYRTVRLPIGNLTVRYSDLE